MRTERRLQASQALHRRARAGELVGDGQAPALLGVACGDGDQVELDDAVGIGLHGLFLRAHGEAVCALLGQMREAVVQVLRGHAHVECARVDELLGDEPWVRVKTFTHGMARHVLDAAGKTDVVCAGDDAAGQCGDGGHRAGAPAVDGVSGNAARQPGEHGRGTADVHALVTDLRRRGDCDIVDALRRQRWVAPQQLANGLDDEVVGSGLLVHALGLAERGTDPIDEDHTPLGGGACAHSGSQRSVDLVIAGLAASMLLVSNKEA